MNQALDQLAALLRHRRVVALTGAGCSTESGIPDYRGATGERRRKGHPLQYAEFVGSSENRQRYWARSMIGWPRFARARPNPAHRGLAQMESRGKLTGVITQNVDGLHQRAGSRRVVELHGNLEYVQCLSCEQTEARDALQARMEATNRQWLSAHRDSATTELADGDAELDPERCDYRSFTVVDCQSCGGLLKPSVTFFGENIPREIREQASAMIDGAQALLVVGSSLAVGSSYRLLRQAARRQIPLGLINNGQPRGVELFDVNAQGLAGHLLPELLERL